ncbi:hypothetical protein RCL1_005207 [Eukaryota sp. TZLM3-RCL]
MQFEYHCPTKYILGKKVNTIGSHIAECGLSKVLIVYGKQSIFKNGCYNEVVESLKANSLSYVEVGGVQANPEIAKVREGIEAYRNNSCDCVLAIGGGSVVDSCKAICAGISYKGDAWDLFEQQLPITSAPPLFVVLTLSATGSEKNCNAVVSNSAVHKKYHIGAPCLFPVVSIVDPTYQLTLPWYETVNGAVDTIVHLWEAYAMAKPCGYPATSLRYVEGLMLAAFDSLEALHKDETNYQARADLCWAATLALDLSTTCSLEGGDWFVHMLEHATSAVNTRVSHGAGLGVIMPAYWKFLATRHPEQLPTLERLARNVFNVATVDEMIQEFRNRLTQYGHPTSFTQPISSWGGHPLFETIDNDTIKLIADAYINRKGFYGGLVQPTYEDAIEMLNELI